MIVMHTNGIRWNIASPKSVPVAIAVKRLRTYLKETL